jgi:hypothetical protein
MNAALTILSGLALLVLGQIIIRTFIDPIYDLRKLCGEIADALLYHASTYMIEEAHKTPEMGAAWHAFRSLSGRLEAKRHALPFYRAFAFIKAVPDLDSIDHARINLICLGASIMRGKVEHSERHRNEIIKALNLRVPD